MANDKNQQGSGHPTPPTDRPSDRGGGQRPGDGIKESIETTSTGPKAPSGGKK